MLELAVLALGFLFGFVIGRWWTVLVAVPIGYAVSEKSNFEGLSVFEVGTLTAIATGVGLVVGIGARKVVDGLRPAG